MKNYKTKSLLVIAPMVLMLLASCGQDQSPSPENQRLFHSEKEAITMSEVIVNGEGQGHQAPSVGDTKILVIPVQFTDYLAEDIAKTETNAGRGADNASEDIRKVFFGEAEETQWHSLRSYYYESSYGKLNFNGIVLPWQNAFISSETYTPVSVKQFSEGGGGAASLASSILSLYKQFRYAEVTNPDTKEPFKSGNEFAQYFDSNKDGCIDVIEMVYTCPPQVKDEDGKPINNDLYWAYCGGTTTKGDIDSPRMSKWAWQSYWTMFEAGYYDEAGKHHDYTNEEVATGVAKADCHTIIHETGHALGLADYYDYDNKKNPVASVDMMGYNIGDHNSYSKSLYGWIDPIVVTGPTQVEISSFTEKGDAIYVPYRGYYEDEGVNKNTFFTEYIAIELYNPTGVNEFDSIHSLNGNYPTCPTTSGIKVYHVDSRLGLFKWDPDTGSTNFVSHTESLIGLAQYQHITTAASNTGSSSYDSKANLIEYVYAQPTQYGPVANDNLFQEGDSFGYETYENYEFNSGKSFGYKFSIDSLSEDSATITFYAA